MLSVVARGVQQGIPRPVSLLAPLVAESAARELERSGFTGVGWSRVRDG